MFDADKYITRGVDVEIPPLIQQILWNMIFSLSCPADYLQVFRLHGGEHNGRLTQVVEHEQEQPAHKNRYEFPFPEPVDAKIFVIDDGDYATMLLSEEY